MYTCIYMDWSLLHAPTVGTLHSFTIYYMASSVNGQDESNPAL